MKLLVSIIGIIILSITSIHADAVYWQPSPDNSFDWYKSSGSNKADIIDVDAFDTTQKIIKGLHNKGKKVVCYVNIGAVEDWRADTNNFPGSVIGKDYGNWEGEKFLDIRQISILEPIMKARFLMAKEKGCDGIDLDNMDTYQQETGFPLSLDNQISYNITMANLVHELGMSVGLKNNTNNLSALSGYFDFLIMESCTPWGFCKDALPFRNEGKLVVQIEYTELGMTKNSFCKESKKNKYFGILKHTNLDSFSQYCSQL